MKRLILGSLILCYSTCLNAQGVRHDNIALKTVTPTGSGVSGPLIQPVASASILVCVGSVVPSAGNTCTGTPANIFADRLLTLGKSNPFNADVNGNFGFWIAPGPYVVSISGTGVNTYSYPITIACNPTDACVSTGSQRFSGGVTIDTLPLNVTVTGTFGALQAFNAGIVTTALTDSALTPSLCVHATTGGLLQSTAADCGVATSGAVTSFSYSETGIDPLDACTVTNPTTTPNLNCVATTVQPSQFLRGPVPTGTTTNPTFENSAVNASVSNGTTVTVTNRPAVATSAAILFGSTGTGQAVPVPDGSWTDFPVVVGSSNSKPHYKNISSGASLTASSTIGVSDSWSSSLMFLGGSVTSIPQNANLTNTCGTGCATGALGAVTAGHTIAVFGYWASATLVPSDVRAVDSVGNKYFLALFAPNLGSNGHFALIAQNVAAGTPTITVNTSVSLNFSGVVAFDLAGPTAYYTGPNGPWQFGPLTPVDLSVAGVGIMQSFVSTTTTCPTAAAAGSTCSFTITWPSAFVDTNYAPSCMGGGTITGFPVIQGFSSKTTTALTVVVENGTANEAVASGYSEMDCIARHP